VNIYQWTFETKEMMIFSSEEPLTSKPCYSAYASQPIYTVDFHEMNDWCRENLKDRTWDANFFGSYFSFLYKRDLILFVVMFP